MDYSGKQSFRLINPHVEGSINKVVEAKNSFSAAKKFYKALSEPMTNYVKEFHMTIQNVETDALSHYEVNERLGKNGNVSFDLSKLPGNLPDKESQLLKAVAKREFRGGKKHKTETETDDDSSSSDEDEEYVQVLPITRFVYYAFPYFMLKPKTITVVRPPTIFLPMFGLPINPILEINYDIYF